MLIEYRANGLQREVRDSVGSVLIARSIARPVISVSSVADIDIDQPVAEDSADISPRTGKPKRQYKRRDLQSE